jgi:D-alanine-D-alanine ligase
MDRIRVAVLMGGPSSEHDVSLASGSNVVDALDVRRYEIKPVVISSDGRWQVAIRPVEAASKGARVGGFDPKSQALPWRVHDNAWSAIGELAEWKTDVALPILHGRFGEDGTVQACLATAGIRFAGSGARASAIAIDKIHTKEILSFHGVANARFRILSREDLARNRPALAQDVVAQLGAPVVVKDPLGGSSLEVRICDDAVGVALAFEKLAPGADRLMAEAYVRGREFTGGVLDDRERGRPMALPLVELRPRSSRFFDYHEKYNAEGAHEICPADVAPELEAAGRALALRVHALLGLRGVSRTDMILGDDSRFVVLEVNTMPGMTSRSLIPLAASAAGIDFAGVVERLIRTAGFD